jgi:hypothetical protein
MNKFALACFCLISLQSFGVASFEKKPLFDCDINPEDCLVVPQGPGSGGTGGPDDPVPPKGETE